MGDTIWRKLCYDVGKMWRLRSILAVVCTALLFACLSPTLPLPPPDVLSQTEGPTPGTIHLTGHVQQPNAVIVIENMNTALPPDQRVSGTIADANGNWEANVIASKGDTLDIYQQVGNDESPYTTYTVR